MNPLANIITPGVRLKLHRFGTATVSKVGPDHITKELVAEVKPDEGGSLYLTLAYCAKVVTHGATPAPAAPAPK